VIVAPTRYGIKIPDITEELHNAIDLGYEGLILRTNDTGYEAGKRSKSLVKIKKWLDGEFLVTNIVPSVDGWAVLECTHNGGFFRVSAPGTIDNKFEIMMDKENYIGRYVNVEFFEWTNDGIPFHPVAKYFRS
jgi:hypothetical protein